MKTTRLQYSCLEERNLLASLASPDGVAIADNSLVVHTGAFDHLGEEESGNGGGAGQVATVINGANDRPVVEGPLEFEFSQNDGEQTIDLLTGASDPDGDELNVSDLRTSSTTPVGTAITGNNLVVRTGAYGYLGEGESETFEIRYLIVDGNGGNVAQVVTVTINGADVAQAVTVTINGANDRPVVEGPLEFEFFQNVGVQTIDLLEGASDPDGDELNVSDRRQVGSVPPAGTEIVGNNLVMRTDAFSYLGEGESETFDVEYFIVDGNGGGVGQMVTVTINGANDPQVGALTQDAETLIEDLVVEEPDRIGDVSDVLRRATQLVHPDNPKIEIVSGPEFDGSFEIGLNNWDSRPDLASNPATEFANGSQRANQGHVRGWVFDADTDEQIRFYGDDAFQEVAGQPIVLDTFDPGDYTLFVQTQSNDHTPAIQSDAAAFSGIDSLELKVLDQVIADLATEI